MMTAPSILVHYTIYVHSSTIIFDKLNILTMDNELVLGSFSLATFNTLPKTIIYWKAIKHLNIRQADLLKLPGTCERWRIECCVMTVSIRDYCVGNDCQAKLKSDTPFHEMEAISHRHQASISRSLQGES